MSVDSITLRRLAVNEPSLTELELKKIEGVEKLAKVLENNITLRKLTLWTTHIGDQESRALAAMLRVNRGLRDMMLYANEMGAKGGQIIAEALNVNNTLESLAVIENKLEEGGAIAFAGLVRANRTLTSLNLGMNNFGHEGCVALGEAMKVNNTIRTLGLPFNFAAAESPVLADVIRTNRTLTYLDLRSRGYADLKVLAEAIDKNDSLLTFEIDEVPKDLQEQFAAKFKQNKELADKHQAAKGKQDKEAASVKAVAASLASEEQFKKFSDGTTYVGLLKEGKAHGTGLMVYPSPDPRMEYDGSFIDGMAHGRGTMTYRNGEVYSGMWVRDQRNGIGRFNGRTGTWVDGVYSPSCAERVGSVLACCFASPCFQMAYSCDDPTNCCSISLCAACVDGCTCCDCCAQAQLKAQMDTGTSAAYAFQQAVPYLAGPPVTVSRQYNKLKSQAHFAIKYLDQAKRSADRDDAPLRAKLDQEIRGVERNKEALDKNRLDLGAARSAKSKSDREEKISQQRAADEYWQRDADAKRAVREREEALLAANPELAYAKKMHDDQLAATNRLTDEVRAARQAVGYY